MALQDLNPSTFPSLIENEGTVRAAGSHPIAQVLRDWTDRAVTVGGASVVALSQNDLELALDLLTQYEERLWERAVAEGIWKVRR